MKPFPRMETNMALNGPDYSGPSAAQLNAALVNTKAEVEAG